MLNPLSTRKSLLINILLSGLLVGSLDLLFAFVDFMGATGKDPAIILKFIASGLLGKPALTGNTGVAVAGLLLHYLIAFSFTSFLWWIFPKWTFLSWNAVLTGFLYGIFIWCVMNLVVVPLSRIPPPPSHNIPRMVKSALVLIGMIGLPLSFIVYQYFHAGHRSAEQKT